MLNRKFILIFHLFIYLLVKITRKITILKKKKNSVITTTIEENKILHSRDFVFTKSPL